MMRHLSGLPFLFVAVAMALGGCRSTEKRTYQVAVVNAANQPVMLWLTKDGPPPEGAWLTPSQWLQLRHDSSIPADVPEPGVQLPPGTRVDLGPQAGEFDLETSAVLLVYSMPVTLDEMAATPRRTSLMDVVYLVPGQNYVMVRSASPVEAERVARLEGRPAAEPGGQP